MNQQFPFCYFLSWWLVGATNKFIEPYAAVLRQFHRKQNAIKPDCQIILWMRIQFVISPCQDFKNIRRKLTRRVPESVSPMLQCNDDDRRVIMLALSPTQFPEHVLLGLWVESNPTS